MWVALAPAQRLFGRFALDLLEGAALEVAKAALAQAAALLTFSEEQPKDPENTLYYFVGIDGARFKRVVEPGDQLILEAKFLSCKRSIWKFECQATVDGKAVCSAEIICAERKL